MKFFFPLTIPLVVLLCLSACSDDQPLEARRETRGAYTVIWLHGTPYEMGQQHARLLAKELEEGLEAIDQDMMLKAMFAMARQLGLVDLARKQSYPDLLEECRGMADAAKDIGWTEEHCLVLNFGDMVAEFVLNGMPKAKDISPGCSQVVAAGEATPNGRLYHARIIDWSRIDFIVDNPVIFVRQPRDKIPHVVIGFPGNLSPYQGMNDAGLSMASNEIHPKNNTVNDRTGRSHVQLQGEMLARARTLAQAREMVRKVNHMTLEIIVVADGNAGKGEVMEMSPSAVAVRGMKGGMVHATNHFREAATAALDKDPAPEHSAIRFERLQQLVEPGAAGTRHGKLDPATLVTVMRDRLNPRTNKESPATTFDDGLSLATNGALYQVVFDPAARRFWVAAGKVPVPAQAFTGFSLDELLDQEGTAPAIIP